MSGDIDYAAAIADLERRRDELDRMIASLRTIWGVGPTGGGPSGGTPNGGPSGRQDAPREIRSDTFFNMKAPEAVRSYLAIMKRPQSVKEIEEGLLAGGFISSAKDLYNNPYTTVTRLQDAEEVVKVHGKWGLAEWYPARRNPKARAEPDASDKGESESASGAVADAETAA